MRWEILFILLLLIACQPIEEYTAPVIKVTPEDLCMLHAEKQIPEFMFIRNLDTHDLNIEQRAAVYKVVPTLKNFANDNTELIKVEAEGLKYWYDNEYKFILTPITQKQRLNFSMNHTIHTYNKSEDTRTVDDYLMKRFSEQADLVVYWDNFNTIKEIYKVQQMEILVIKDEIFCSFIINSNKGWKKCIKKVTPDVLTYETRIYSLANNELHRIIQPNIECKYS